MKIKSFLTAVGCMILLCGCTKSNIVNPESQAEVTPDMNIYFDITLDQGQLREDVRDIYLDEDEYPMGSKINLDLKLEEELVDVTIVVKDGTSPEDAAEYADIVLKGINDECAMQDFSYGESGEDTFGGLYQDNEIHLVIYEDSAYSAKGEPMYEVTVPKDIYMTFEIE